jgi:ribonuclease J
LRTALQFGPFRVTPHLVDHSAYDAHAIQVEAGGKRLFYSGDIRGHGRKAALFERLVSHPPQNVDVMLMEGSSFGRLDPDLSFPTESEVEQRLLELFGEANGLAPLRHRRRTSTAWSVSTGPASGPSGR